MSGWASDRFVAALREIVPLEAALGEAAELLRAATAAGGVAISIKRDGRALRGRAGIVGQGDPSARLCDPEVEGTLRVAGVAESDLRAAALLAAQALAARFLGESAQFDGLTGVLNRRAFDARLREEWLRAQRNESPLAVAMVDVDFFKAYNDRRGHQAGDDVLRRVAQAAAASLQRAGDRFARYGGEEFSVILPETDLAGAIAAAELMREAVRGLAIPHPVGKGGRVTVSVGVAVAHRPAADKQELVDAADRELYRAKSTGRDRVAAENYISPNAVAQAAPQPLVALAGRDGDVARVLETLDRAAFVTLTGPGGIGKTRLALAVATRAERFDHVRFVDLPSTLDSADAANLIRAAVEPGGNALVVVDGCEQVTEACRSALQTAQPPLRLLATSRVPLGVPDERVIRLQPLDDAAARALFVERAKVAGVVVDAGDASAARLLRRLGGMPQAILLAVTQLREASIEDVLANFKSRSSASSERATLGSLLRGAVTALHPEETAALVGTSAFAMPFTSAAAASVIPLDGLDEPRAAALLERLHDASLLGTLSSGGITRWRAIDPVRAAALEAAGAEAYRAALRAHLTWCRNTISEIDGRYGAVESKEFCAAVAPLSPELQAALDRALQDAPSLDDGVELCASAVRYWFASGQIAEASARCEAFLDVAEGRDRDRHLRLLNHAMRISFAAADFSAMERYARKAESLIAGEDSQRWASTLNYLGLAAKMRGEYDVAEARFLENREVSVRIGYRRGEGIATGALGTIADDIRLDFPKAAELYARSAEIFNEIHDDLNTAIMLSNVAVARTMMGDFSGARQPATAALEGARSFGYPALLVHTLDTVASLEISTNNLPAARDALREAAAILNPDRDFNQPLLYVQLARFAFAIGCLDETAHLLGAADAADARRGTPTQPIERHRRKPLEASLKQSMGDVRYALEIERGRRMADDEIIDAARRMLDEAFVPA